MIEHAPWSQFFLYRFIFIFLNCFYVFSEQYIRIKFGVTYLAKMCQSRTTLRIAVDIVIRICLPIRTLNVDALRPDRLLDFSGNA